MNQIKKLFFPILLNLALSGGLAQAATATEPAKPFPPFRIAGNLYFVGNKDQADYLVVTPKGNILINSDYKINVALLKSSIEKLGFKFNDTKIILISQAHIDHDGASAYIKAKTGAAYMVMDEDVAVVESGGKADFQYGNSPSQLYRPAKVDRVLHDGDEVKLDNTVLVAHLTPGHTKGCTTWTMKINENGNEYNTVIVGGPYVNPGYKLVNNETYPNIAQDYEHMWQTLKTLPCDIFLGAHGVYFGLEEKYARMKDSVVNPFIDPEGYQTLIAQAQEKFDAELKKQQLLSQQAG